MDTFKDKLKRLIPTKRKLIQLYTAVLFNANLKGFVNGEIYKGDTKRMCVPGMNCYSCPGAVGACPLGSLQGAFVKDRSSLYYVCGILFLYGVIFGRMICGWLCPFGLIQELLYKIKTPKLKKSKVTRVLSYLKYVILVFFVIIVPIVYATKDTPLPGFCKYICPSGTLEGGLSLLSHKLNESFFSMLGPIFTWKFMMFVSIMLGCIFAFRLFCRFICPLGAIYALFNKFSFFGVKVSESKCTHCNLCVSHCKMDIKKVGDMECINCGECVNVCPTNAIEWKGAALVSKIKNTFGNPNATKENDQNSLKKTRYVTRAITTAILVIFLGFVIYHYWTDDTGVKLPPVEPPTVEGETGNNDLVYGTGIGNLCYGYDINIVTKDAITTNTINPAKTGKITIINFWGTWCGPCVKELPYFDQMATNYADTVNVIAIHSYMLNETAPEFIGTYYPDSKMTFATDTDSDAYYTMLGGRSTYPYTVIIDENGVILATFVKSLHYEDLQKVVDDHLNGK